MEWIAPLLQGGPVWLVVVLVTAGIVVAGIRAFPGILNARTKQVVELEHARREAEIRRKEAVIEARDAASQYYEKYQAQLVLTAKLMEQNMALERTVKKLFYNQRALFEFVTARVIRDEDRAEWAEMRASLHDIDLDEE